MEVAKVVMLPVKKVTKPRTSMASWRNLQTIMEDRTSKGWGKLVEIPEKKNRFGLGYQPSKTTKKGKGQFPPIQKTFISKGVEHGGQVTMISNKSSTKSVSHFICERAPSEELKN